MRGLSPAIGNPLEAPIRAQDGRQAVTAPADARLDLASCETDRGEPSSPPGSVDASVIHPATLGEA
jgi:hypothetical protein